MSDLAIAEQAHLSLAMILLRRGAAEAASRALQLPSAGRLATTGPMTVLWHGADRFLAMRDGVRPRLADELAPMLAQSAYAADVSASRLVVTVSGSRAIEALNTLLPIDLHPRVFAPGSVALTRAAHIDVAVWRAGDQPAFGLACARSYADSFRHCLASL